MYKTIDERNQIQKYQENFQQRIIELSDGKSKIHLGYQSGSGEVECYWFENLHFWIAFGMETTKSGDERYWNSFGFSSKIPNESSTQTIINQINIKCEGNDRKTAASYGINENDEIVVLHRVHRGILTLNPNGKINSYYDKYYPQDELIQEKDGQSVFEYALVCELESDQIILQLYNFKKFVEELKDQVRAIKSNNTPTSSQNMGNYIF